MTNRAMSRIPAEQSAPAQSWPVTSGAVPSLATAFHPRPETGLALAGDLNPGETAVLTQGGAAGRGAAGSGAAGSGAAGSGAAGSGAAGSGAAGSGAAGSGAAGSGAAGSGAAET